MTLELAILTTAAIINIIAIFCLVIIIKNH